MIARLRRVPAPVVVVVAVALWAAWLARWSLHVESFVWLIDELLYSKTALFYSDGAHLGPQLFGQPEAVPNPLYPLLLAPVYALFGSVTAFHLVHAINAMLFASTAAPIYLLARRTLELPWGYALAAGLSAVMVPWAVAVNVVMTESLAYPLFAWAVFAMSHAIARPSPRHDVLAVIAIGAASLARAQFFLLAAIFLLALALEAFSAASPAARAGASLRERLRPHAVLGGLVAVAALALLVALAASVDVAGSYRGTFEKPPFPSGWLTASGRHLAHLVVGVGILPAILFFAWLPRALGWPANRGQHAFALVAAPTFAVIAYQVGFFTQAIAGGQYQERYVFYLAPLLTVGATALVADRRLPAPRASLALGAVTAAAFVAAADPLYPGGESLGAFSRIANAGSAFNAVIEGQVRVWSPRLLFGKTLETVDALLLLTVVLGVVSAVVLRPAWRRWAGPALAVAVVLGGAVQAIHLVPKSARAINESYPYVLPHVREVPRDWIDRAVGEEGRVGLVTGYLQQGDENLQWQWHTFWNKRVERILQVQDRPGIVPYSMTATRVDPRDGRIHAEADGTTHLFVSRNDATLRVRGRQVASAPDGASVIVPDRPWQASSYIDGLGKARQRLLVFARVGERADVRGSVRLTLTPPADVKRAVRVVIDAAGPPIERMVPRDGEVSVRVARAGRHGAPPSLHITTEEGYKPQPRAQPARAGLHAPRRRGLPRRADRPGLRTLRPGARAPCAGRARPERRPPPPRARAPARSPPPSAARARGGRTAGG